MSELSQVSIDECMRSFSSYPTPLLTLDIALLPAPFLSSQRRARAMSHAQAPLVPVVDNAQLGTPSRSVRSMGILNTPPPQPGYRLRGSVTDPAHTRRRPAFEQVRSCGLRCITRAHVCNLPSVAEFRAV